MSDPVTLITGDYSRFAPEYLALQLASDRANPASAVYSAALYAWAQRDPSVKQNNAGQATDFQMGSAPLDVQAAARSFLPATNFLNAGGDGTIAPASIPESVNPISDPAKEKPVPAPVVASPPPTVVPAPVVTATPATSGTTVTIHPITVTYAPQTPTLEAHTYMARIEAEAKAVEQDVWAKLRAVPLRDWLMLAGIAALLLIAKHVL